MVNKLKLTFANLIAVALVLTILPSTQVLACSCLESSIKDQAESASIIFKGQLSTQQTEKNGYSEYKTMDFIASQYWKGNLGNAEVTVQTPANSAACGIDTEIGKEYIIFASETEGMLWTNSCRGSSLASTAYLENLKSDLGEGEYVKNLFPPKNSPQLNNQAQLDNINVILMVLFVFSGLNTILAVTAIGMIIQQRKTATN